jgi:hypothetical protein
LNATRPASPFSAAGANPAATMPATVSGERWSKRQPGRNNAPRYQERVDAELATIMKATTGEWSALALGNALIGTGGFPNMTGDGLSKGIIQVLLNVLGTHAFRCARRDNRTTKWRWKEPPPNYDHTKIWAAKSDQSEVS